ncbi:class I SAM-dependent methyltransferase [Sedimenticola sp.]|uniref:class I SAM-dependent methyltransferase n=1 Tax=Sedimenticola sp. TaxID=1940285 RepID=UPI00258A3F2A|nr:class I SAM-dependent methyltransferase [Sedimenticola sp.]MCW8902449.1 class I SAM-dependent methyltransferase [Sedimenticola sp.]
MTIHDVQPMTTAAQGQDVDGVAQTPACTKPRMMERDEWNQRYTASDFIWTVNANRFLTAELVGQSRGRALDLACGEGRNAVWLAQQGWKVSAVDFSDVAIDKGRRLATTLGVASRIEFIDADLRQYQPAPQTFDLVALIYLQIPLNQLTPILLRAAAALRPGGTFLLVAHDSDNLRRGYGGPQHPAMLYAAEDVAAAVEGPLRIEKATLVERVVATAEGSKLAIDCLVRGTKL